MRIITIVKMAYNQFYEIIVSLSFISNNFPSFLLCLCIIVDMIKRIKAARQQIDSKTINKLPYFEKSFFTFRARPIIISTIPTITFPIAIDKVESIYTFDSTPPVIAITSLPAHILKAPPKKKPIVAERNIVTTTLKSSALKKIVRQKPINKHE